MRKVGLIGLGNRVYLADLIKENEGWEIAVGADPSESARNKFHEKYPEVALTADYHDVLRDPEIKAVFILSPDFTHEEIGCEALEAGKPVYLEKPIAISIEGSDRLLATAKRTGTRLFVGHNMRYFPAILKMKEVIDSGLIGEVQCGWCRHFIAYGGDAYFRDWHSEQKNTCGLLLQKGAHDIDVMHFLMHSHSTRVVGMGMLSVYNRCPRRDPDTPGCAEFRDDQYPPLECTGFSPVIDVEDHNMVMMQLESGAQMTYMQCHYAPNAERNYTFIGTKGRVENIGDSGKCEVHVWTQRGPRTTPDIVYYLKECTGSHGGSDPAIVRNFFDFITTGAATTANPVAARDAVAAGVLGHVSMRNGNMPQEIPQVSKEIREYFENFQTGAKLV